MVKLAPERKHLTNLLKMVAYQAESELLRSLNAHYRRPHDEGRTLIQSALASEADLEVTESELRVTLVPLNPLSHPRPRRFHPQRRKRQASKTVLAMDKHALVVADILEFVRFDFALLVFGVVHCALACGLAP